MRVACLSYSAIPSRTANAVHIMKMCQAFASLKHEVTLYARFGDEPAQDIFAHYGVERSFEIVRCCWPPLRDFGGPIYGLRVAKRVLARPLPDVCYSRDIYSQVACASIKRPIILEAHVPPRTVVGRSLQTFVFKRPHFWRLVVITQALQEEYRRLFPWFPGEKILVAPDGADIPNFDGKLQPEEAKRDQRRRLQVGYVGHLYRGRGIDLIFAMAKQLPEMEFHVVGGMEEDVIRWRKLAAGLLNLSIHGHVAPAKAEEFRQGMDVLLAPYQQGTVGVSGGGSLETSRWMSPMKIFEYMASRRPIIASDLPVLREVLTHDVNARLVPPADVTAWVGALRSLGGDPALRQRLAERAFEDVSSQFTWTIRADRILRGVQVGASTGPVGPSA